MPVVSGSIAQASRCSALASRPRRTDHPDRPGFFTRTLLGARGNALVAVSSLLARKRATRLELSMKLFPEILKVATQTLGQDGVDSDPDAALAGHRPWVAWQCSEVRACAGLSERRPAL